MLLLIGIPVLFVAFWYFCVKPLSYWSNMGVPQTKPWPILGDFWLILLRKMSNAEFTQLLYNMYPSSRYLGLYRLTKPMFFLKDPQLIKQFCVKDFDHFTDHSNILDPDADPLWNKALFSLKGDRWKEMRNIVSPTFTSNKIKSIYVLMVDTAENFIKYFDQQTDDDVIELEMKDAFSRFANDIIATSAFGVKVDSLQERENDFYQMGKKITDFGGVLRILKFILIMAMPKLCMWLDIRFLNKKAANYFTGVIEDTIRAREENKIVRPDIIHHLLEARRNQAVSTINGTSKHIVQISNMDITSQAVIFFFAGFDTISTAMCFASYELALNTPVQDRLRKEIQEAAKDGKITYDTLQQMPYLDMVVSETLRKWPPFPVIDRSCTKPYTLEPTNKNEPKITFKKNDLIWLPLYSLQRDPKYFPGPEKFDPERFSEENKSKIVPYTYMPFGVGPRLCIGNRFALIEIKVVLYHLLLNYEIVTTKKTSMPLVLKKGFPLLPEGGFCLGLKRIKTII